MHELNPVEWAILPLKKYAVFTGRAPRAEYWWFYLLTLVVSIPAALTDKALGVNFVATIVNLVFLVPWIGVTIRRLHDTDRSGWWLLAFVGGFAVLGAVAAVGAITARETSAASFTAIIAAAVIFLAIVVTFLVFMVLPGTDGSNSYGADPYGPDNLEEVFA